MLFYTVMGKFSNWGSHATLSFERIVGPIFYYNMESSDYQEWNSIEWLPTPGRQTILIDTVALVMTVFFINKMKLTIAWLIGLVIITTSTRSSSITLLSLLHIHTQSDNQTHFERRGHQMFNSRAISSLKWYPPIWKTESKEIRFESEKNFFWMIEMSNRMANDIRLKIRSTHKSVKQSILSFIILD